MHDDPGSQGFPTDITISWCTPTLSYHPKPARHWKNRHAGPLYHLYHPSSFIHPIDPIDPFLVAQRQVNPLYTPLVIQHNYGKSPFFIAKSSNYINRQCVIGFHRKLLVYSSPTQIELDNIYFKCPAFPLFSTLGLLYFKDDPTKYSGW
jgi:hypothetical protein